MNAADLTLTAPLTSMLISAAPSPMRAMLTDDAVVLLAEGRSDLEIHEILSRSLADFEG